MNRGSSGGGCNPPSCLYSTTSEKRARGSGAKSLTGVPSEFRPAPAMIPIRQYDVCFVGYRTEIPLPLR